MTTSATGRSFDGARVLVATEHFPNPYKPWIVHQIEEMTRRGARVDVVAFGQFPAQSGEWKQVPSDIGIRYLPATLRGAFRGRARMAAWDRYKARRALAAFSALKKGQGGQIPTALAGALRSLGLPKERPDVWYIHDLAPAARLAFVKDLYPSATVIVSFNGGEVAGLRRHPSTALAIQKADHIVALSTFAASQIEGISGCEGKMISRVPLGFPLHRYPTQPGRRFKPDGMLRLITVGRLSPEKGIADAVEAIARIRDAGLGERIHLSIVGNGIERQRLAALVRDRALEGVVEFLGELSPDAVASAMIGSDALLLPSHRTATWAETQATVVQEALLLGCMAITTAEGALSETNAPSMHRFFFRAGDPQDLAQRILQLLSLSEHEWRIITDEAEAFVRSRFDIQRTVGDLEDLVRTMPIGPSGRVRGV
jgi:glycosyltransferase involved in cell wall biosynthesis